jgi:predicted PhzF superfamily epimerase YddE/YHI9
MNSRRSTGRFLVKTSRLQEIGTRYAAVQGQEMGRDARLLVSVSDGGSRIDIGGRVLTLINGTIEA